MTCDTCGHPLHYLRRAQTWACRNPHCPDNPDYED